MVHVYYTNYFFYILLDLLSLCILYLFEQILSAHWGTKDNSRNSIFTLVLLIAAVIIFITKIVLIIVFSFVRPLRRTSKGV